MPAVGAVIVCDCCWPSDHPEKLYVTPFLVWGEGALTEFADPTITSFVSGALPVSSPTTTSIPGGELWIVMLTVCGSMRTESVSVLPSESVAVSRSSSSDRYSWSGATNEPEARFRKSSTGCSWQSPGAEQWWRISAQSSVAPSIAPSSGSIAEPEKLIVRPTRQVSVATGAAMVALGGPLPALIVRVSVSKPPLVSVAFSVTV